MAKPKGLQDRAFETGPVDEFVDDDDAVSTDLDGADFVGDYAMREGDPDLLPPALQMTCACFADILKVHYQIDKIDIQCEAIDEAVRISFSGNPDKLTAKELFEVEARFELFAADMVAAVRHAMGDDGDTAPDEPSIPSFTQAGLLVDDVHHIPRILKALGEDQNFDARENAAVLKSHFEQSVWARYTPDEIEQAIQSEEDAFVSEEFLPRPFAMRLH